MASKRAFATIPSLARFASPAPARILATRTLIQPRRLPVSIPCTAIRLAHSIPRPSNPSPFKQEQDQPTTPSESSSSSPSSPEPSQPAQPPNVRQQPHYELTFTCRPCGERSRHRVSKQGYHHGSVLIACPGCSNRHVISDHLRIFGDTAMTVEDLLREKGELVKRGTLGAGGEEGDLEFWDDGTSTVREPWEEKKKKTEAGGAELPPGASFKSVKSGEGRKGDV
ncbi:DNL zinc finger-domain-containing protein [Chaetomidium leptoderma]|uniref:DNL zinc finger-domain-containing protein n=1 Tax=Chaetomidium leptoderma TaxID=669021 RepID=A0AAN6VH90_9PEZI|nr:DNL zinc finger-domain-containing protein [Chaetomidium leptoderma]